MERQTVQFTLPDSKAIVTLYEKLTYGQLRQIKKMAFDSMKMHIDPDTKSYEIKDISGGFQIEGEDQAVLFCIKSISSEVGEIAEAGAIKQVIDNLSEA